MEQMKTASDTGRPVMRPLFYDFPGDQNAYGVEDEYMFGPDLLVAPVIEQGVQSRTVYLPAGSRWTDACTGDTQEGGCRIEVPAPLEKIPVFYRDGKDLGLFR